MKEKLEGSREVTDPSKGPGKKKRFKERSGYE